MVNQTIMLDTSAYSLFKRGNPEVVDRIRSTSRILIPSIVIGELLAGFEGGSKKEQNRKELDAFTGSARVQMVSITPDTAQRYAHIYKYLKTAGTPVPTNDLWIAASAMEHNAELITSDHHFSYIPHILVHLFTP